MDCRISTPVQPRTGAVRGKRPHRALTTSVAVLLGLFGCSTAPKTGEGELLASRFKLERRYQIEALRFKALDETGYDRSWFAP